MAQSGAKISVTQRIETLKGWAKSQGKIYGKVIPLVVVPVTTKPRKTFKKR